VKGEAMQYRQIGKWGPRISVLGLGSWETWGDALDGLHTIEHGRGADDPADLQQLARSLPEQLKKLSLSYVHLPADAMGRWAFAEAQRRLADPTAAPAHQTFRPSLKLGNMTAPPVAQKQQ
jgi:hypothetical protein